MAKLNMDWFVIGNMTLGEVKTCLWAHDKISETKEYELYNVVFTAVANANGGDKNNKPFQLHKKQKEIETYDEIKKEMELLGITK